jgi:hypothetical protein
MTARGGHLFHHNDGWISEKSVGKQSNNVWGAHKNAYVHEKRQRVVCF